jgi:hypothetical protein
MNLVVAIKTNRQEELHLIEPVPESPPPVVNLAGYA